MPPQKLVSQLCNWFDILGPRSILAFQDARQSVGVNYPVNLFHGSPGNFHLEGPDDIRLIQFECPQNKILKGFAGRSFRRISRHDPST